MGIRKELAAGLAAVLLAAAVQSTGSASAAVGECRAAAGAGEIATTATSWVNPRDFLLPINRARAEVDVRPVTWSAALERAAENHATRLASFGCEPEPSGAPGVGETIVSVPEDVSVPEAIALWVDQKAHYDYETNSCSPGKRCSDYTQIVWRDTSMIGGAVARCENGQKIIVVLYNPQGNLVGERPY
ncbi:CAP domain-containing protein [Lentzea sp. NEAU-D7]|uniref:CAP domain-containing protein n=1 Tax=Lentzea sp. NEAU-D7 TaxID=2994667 RepID=UPI00224AFB8B|nr:CAP domain-containing protein [Lentzea sp. NEAU-D7]MCX2952774.1 CAP domain-containing protein [Lentzea sp. NEAU-D7]